jgi:hypothetical protein
MIMCKSGMVVGISVRGIPSDAVISVQGGQIADYALANTWMP